jgi:hypothetical protein
VNYKQNPQELTNASLEGFTETQNPKKVAEQFATWAKEQTKEGN